MNEKRVTPALCASLGNGERGAFTDRTTVSAAGRAPAMGACAYDGNDARPRTRSERVIMGRMVVDVSGSLHESQRHGINAVAQAGGTRPIIEDVTQMRVAACTTDLSGVGARMLGTRP